MRFLLALRAIFFVLLLPGTVAGYIPFGILSTAGRLRAPELSLSSVGASILVIAGTVVLLRCVWDFFAKGKGTLAPIDPPRVLVVSGLYRFTRNPMYNGVLALTLGEAWLFGSVRVVERGHRRDDTRRQTPDAHPRRDRRVRARAHRGARQGGPPARQGAGQTPRTSTEGASDHRHPWGLCA